jgi:citrate lyase alpha subunit
MRCTNQEVNLNVPLRTFEDLKDGAYALAGTLAAVEFDNQVVALVEDRDGTIIDVVRKKIMSNTPNAIRAGFTI